MSFCSNRKISVKDRLYLLSKTNLIINKSIYFILISSSEFLWLFFNYNYLFKILWGYLLTWWYWSNYNFTLEIVIIDVKRFWFGNLINYRFCISIFKILLIIDAALKGNIFRWFSLVLKSEFWPNVVCTLAMH